jgi:hypothetical protein
MRDGTLKAILWHQGESDAAPGQAAVYAERLEEVLTRLRSELGAPELPILIGQLGRFPGKPWTRDFETVDAAHRAVAHKLRNVAFISAEGLASVGDNLHFDTPSLREFARRYAEAYLRLQR